MLRPAHNTATTTPQAPGRMRWIIIAALAAARTTAAQDCPDGHLVDLDPAVEPSNADTQAPIEFEADGMEAVRGGEMRLRGDVLISQGVRRLRTKDATYDPRTQRFTVDEGVQYSDPNLQVRGRGARIDQQGEAEFDEAEFELPAINARGGARTIKATAAGELELQDVRYTTCPVGNEDWLLRAADIDISQRAGLGVGRGVRLDFKGVPILYAPIISFPVGNERKSGFLFPSVGSSSSSGYSLAVPWYWNIAPNYDATFVPTWYTKRGPRLDAEFRYLTEMGRGELLTQYLPDDDLYGEERNYVHLLSETRFTERLRLDLEGANVSDSAWFEDFGAGPEGSSITYLDRQATLSYLGDEWFALLRAQNLQTIDDRIDPLLRPHTVLPQLAVQANLPDRPFGLAFGLDFEIANFDHNVAARASGWRLDAAPQIRMPLRSAGLYLEPAAAWRYTAYRLDDQGVAGDDSLSRSAPMLSLDAGMLFERLSGSRQQRLQTLEPRIMYLYVPYRSQDELPVFDTALADLNIVQLFRTNRFVGADRLSDANQVSIGVTSRLLEADSGRQFITATVGQAFYFDAPQVSLPGEDREDPESSDIVAELGLTAYADWNIAMGVQWDPGETRSERGDVRIQYRPGYDRVANLGYRFRRGAIEQLEASAAWPVSERWSAYGRFVYSLEDQTALDQFAGFEYRSCCWRLRVVGRRYVSDRTGDRDTSVLLQLELNGLSSVGVGADAFLERSIRGYSLSPPDPQQTR